MQKSTPVFLIDSLIKSLLVAGAILLAGIIIAHPSSWTIDAAAVALVSGFVSFVLASQFLVTIEMGDEEQLVENEKAKDLRLALPFLFGLFAYVSAGVFICVYLIST